VKSVINVLVAVVPRNQVESITVDYSLIFTRYLDAMLFTAEDLKRILQRHLMNGRLGKFILGRSSYIYQDFSVESGKFHDFNKMCFCTCLGSAFIFNKIFTINMYLKVSGFMLCYSS